MHAGTPSRHRAAVSALALCVAFVVLRGLDVYGDPRPWHTSRLTGILAFLNTTKYPASLSFLLMTLGPMFVLLGLAERWRGRFADVLTTFGRVPMFYYLLHIPVIHAAAVIVSLVREGRVNAWLFGNHPMAPPPVPEGYAWSLGLLYVVFVASRGRAVLPVPLVRTAARDATPSLAQLSLNRKNQEIYRKASHEGTKTRITHHGGTPHAARRTHSAPGTRHHAPHEERGSRSVGRR